jgi:hypothetical protein
MPSVPRVEADDKRVDLQVENAFEGDHAAAKAIDAQRAASREHSLSPLAAFKAYKKAICWSVLVSMVRTVRKVATLRCSSCARIMRVNRLTNLRTGDRDGEL